MSALVRRELDNLEEYGAFYSHVCYCKNCGERNICYIKRGNKLAGLLIECDNCDCEILLKAHAKD